MKKNQLNWNDVLKDDLNYMYKSCRSDLLKLSNKKLLFTGGAGFLGYYFFLIFSFWNKKNSDNPIKFTILDTKYVQLKDWKEKLKNNKEVYFVKKDINSITNKFLNSFDIIIHGASIASPTFYRAKPIQTMKANILGLWRILKIFEKNSILNNKKKTLFFFSSSEVYGNPNLKNIPTKENYFGNVSFTGPRACYDESKRFGETLILNYSSVYKFRSIVVRPFNNYGPGMNIDDKRVIPDIFKSVVKNKNIILFSNGKPKRTFCYVSDAVVGYIKALSRGKSRNAYNIGASKPEISINKLSKLAKKISKNIYGYNKKVIKLKSNEKEYLVDNPLRRLPDTVKAKLGLGFKTKVPLDIGLAKTLIYFMHNYK